MTEKEDILSVSLAHSSEEMEKKQEMITQLKKESEESVLHEEHAQTQLKKSAEGEREQNFQHKDFLRKEIICPGQIGLLDKECYRLRDRWTSWRRTGKSGLPICGPRSLPQCRFLQKRGTY